MYSNHFYMYNFFICGCQEIENVDFEEFSIFNIEILLKHLQELMD